MLFLMFAVLRLLVFVLTSSASTVNKAPASAKAAITEARFNNLINNGGSFGGKTYHAGGINISGTNFTLNHGSPGQQGGAPGSYTPSYESALAAEIGSVIDKLAAANVF